jgi:hypothetical protein
MAFYPAGYWATGRGFWRLLAWAATGVPPRGRHRRLQGPEPAREAGPQGEQDVTPGAGINMFAVCARNDHARRVVAGLAAEMPSLFGLWQQVDCALADVPALVAAMRAALAAHAEGEDAPLSYFRDELAGQQALPEPPGGDHDGA